MDKKHLKWKYLLGLLWVFLFYFIQQAAVSENKALQDIAFLYRSAIYLSFIAIIYLIGWWGLSGVVSQPLVWLWHFFHVLLLILLVVMLLFIRIVGLQLEGLTNLYHTLVDTLLSPLLYVVIGLIHFLVLPANKSVNF